MCFGIVEEHQGEAATYLWLRMNLASIIVSYFPPFIKTLESSVNVKLASYILVTLAKTEEDQPKDYKVSDF